MKLQIQIWDKTFNHPKQESNRITHLIYIGSKAIFGIHLNHPKTKFHIWDKHLIIPNRNTIVKSAQISILNM